MKLARWVTVLLLGASAISSIGLIYLSIRHPCVEREKEMTCVWISDTRAPRFQCFHKCLRRDGMDGIRE